MERFVEEIRLSQKDKSGLNDKTSERKLKEKSWAGQNAEGYPQKGASLQEEGRGAAIGEREEESTLVKTNFSQAVKAIE